MLFAVIIQWFTHQLEAYNHTWSALVLFNSSNIHIRASVAYLVEANQFLPVTDGLLPILALQITFYSLLTGFKVFRFVINVVRGAGA